MPNINSLTYNGTKSTDLGVYVTGSGSFDAAEMDADKYEIAGRNGDLIIPKKRFKNIVVTYPAFIPKAFQEKAQSIRNWMRSAKAYARLEDTYDMEHYRLGLASGIQSFEPVNQNDASNFQLSFDCKPQRFLKTGETPLPIEPEAHSYSGEIVEFETVAVDDMTKAEVSLSPIQSLNGYDHPWAAGAGANKCAFPSVDFTLKGVRYYTENGILHMSGTSVGETSSADPAFNALSFTLPAGTYYFSRFSFETASYLKKTSDNSSIAINNGSFTLTEATAVHVGFYVYNKTFSGAAIPLSITVGSTAPSAYTPAANLCPISGHTGATLNVTGKNMGVMSADNASNAQRISLSYQDGGVVATASGSYSRVNYHIPVVVGETYTISFKGKIDSGIFGRVCFGNTPSFDSQYGSIQLNTTETEFTKTITATKEDLYVSPYLTNGNQSNDVMTIEDFQLELGSTASAYEPYAGNQHTATFGQTVYGGTFDFVSGKLTVTWGLIASYNGEILPGRWLSDRDVYAAGTTPTTGAQVADELATPIVIDLDPTEVQTLLGLNNVWASDGTVEINYADPFNVDNPTYFEARPLFEITNPAQGDILNVNGKTITFLSSYTGTVTIDCETMNCYSGYANMNYLISATDFPVLNEGLNIVTWSGSGTCTMTPRWWEL